MFLFRRCKRGTVKRRLTGAGGPRFRIHAGPGATEQIAAAPLAPAVLWLCTSAPDSVCCPLVDSSGTSEPENRELWTPGFTLG